MDLPQFDPKAIRARGGNPQKKEQPSFMSQVGDKLVTLVNPMPIIEAYQRKQRYAENREKWANRPKQPTVPLTPEQKRLNDEIVRRVTRNTEEQTQFELQTQFIAKNMRTPLPGEVAQMERDRQAEHDAWKRIERDARGY